jgi:hypothetical protein
MAFLSFMRFMSGFRFADFMPLGLKQDSEI